VVPRTAGQLTTPTRVRHQSRDFSPRLPPSARARRESIRKTSMSKLVLSSGDVQTGLLTQLFILFHCRFHLKYTLKIPKSITTNALYYVYLCTPTVGETGVRYTVASVTCVFVCLSVRSIKDKRLELSPPTSVDI